MWVSATRVDKGAERCTYKLLLGLSKVRLRLLQAGRSLCETGSLDTTRR